MTRFYLTILFLLMFSLSAFAQTPEKPIPQTEFVQMLYKLPKTPNYKTEIIEAIRQRGIAFELTAGLRGLVASKSGNDAELRRTLEEAARRKENPTASALPPEKEWRGLLAKSKNETLNAVDEMPDFLVKQIINRSIGYAGTNNFQQQDRLTVAVGYRAGKGEEYKVLNINGVTQQNAKENGSYEEVGGTSSTGEFVTVLKSIFQDESKTAFAAIDTDTLRERRCIVFSFEVKRENSKQAITASGYFNDSTIAGYKGKLWIDRESNRVLRIESEATEIPFDFPIRGAKRNIDYDWVVINNQKYLLPIASDVRLTAREKSQLLETRNEIRFREYRKFETGVEIKDLQDTDEIPTTEEKPPF